METVEIAKILVHYLQSHFSNIREKRKDQLVLHWRLLKMYFHSLLLLLLFIYFLFFYRNHFFEFKLHLKVLFNSFIDHIFYLVSYFSRFKKDFLNIREKLPKVK